MQPGQTCQTDIFQHLKVLNQSMQGCDTYILQVQDKVCAFPKKRLCCGQRRSRRELQTCSHYFTRSCCHVTPSSPLIQSQLEHLQGYFKDYFPDLENTHLNWVRNPFAPGVGSSLDLKSQDELIEMTNSGDLKLNFEALPLSDYWLYVRKDYPTLAERALKCLLPFATSCLCESGFSTLKVLKTKHRARLHMDMRIALTDIKPRLDKQAHPSH